MQQWKDHSDNRKFSEFLYTHSITNMKFVQQERHLCKWEMQQEEIQLVVNSIRFIEEQKYRTLESHVLQSFGMKLIKGLH